MKSRVSRRPTYQPAIGGGARLFQSRHIAAASAVGAVERLMTPTMAVPAAERPLYLRLIVKRRRWSDASSSAHYHIGGRKGGEHHAHSTLARRRQPSVGREAA